jgi:hypothetical protein
MRADTAITELRAELKPLAELVAKTKKITGPEFAAARAYIAASQAERKAVEARMPYAEASIVRNLLSPAWQPDRP